MDPLSITASLLTVLEATAVVSKATIKLYRNVRKAPKELAQLSAHISQTRARLDVQLRLYQSLSNGNLKSSLPDDALVTFHTDLENAKTCLESIQNTIAARAGQSNGKQIFDWIMPDQRKVMKIVANLHDIDNGLSSMLNTLSLSPLQEACSYGHSEIARLLLAKGAFLEHVDAGGRTAFTMLWFQLSRPFCRANFLRILLAYSPMSSVFEPSGDLRPLAWAAMRGHAKDIKLLMDSGVYVNVDGKPGNRTINYSIIGSNPATFDFLMPMTPKEWISELDYRGRGPLHKALEYQSYHANEIIKRLLDAGADPHLRDVEGNDPGDTARICDKQAAKDGLQDLGYPQNVRTYFDALLSCGIDVELDEDDNLWWPSEDRPEQGF
ncbi:MAG: hypothetical protein Q9209_000227 [Squamulea sp. 1 TL-2023]